MKERFLRMNLEGSSRVRPSLLISGEASCSIANTSSTEEIGPVIVCGEHFNNITTALSTDHTIRDPVIGEDFLKPHTRLITFSDHIIFNRSITLMPGLPDIVKGYAVSIVSLFIGAATVHNIYQPDLSLPVNTTKPAEKSPPTSPKK